MNLETKWPKSATWAKTIMDWGQLKQKLWTNLVDVVTQVDAVLENTASIRQLGNKADTFKALQSAEGSFIVKVWPCASRLLQNRHGNGHRGWTLLHRGRWPDTIQSHPVNKKSFIFAAKSKHPSYVTWGAEWSVSQHLPIRERAKRKKKKDDIEKRANAS